MPKIEIETCSHTANINALEAVARWMREGYAERQHLKVREITIGSGLKFKVSELVNNGGVCDCKFNVSALKVTL